MAPASPAQPARAVETNRRRVLGRALLLVVLVVVVFAVILPRVVDMDSVVAALGTLTGTQLALLVGATAVAYLANAASSTVLVPGLTWPRAVGADLAARAVASTIPGPTDVATRFVLYRQWEIPAETATAGIVFIAFFETLSVLPLPAISIVGVLLTGGQAASRAIWLALLALLVLVVIAILLSMIVKSENAARRLGELLERAAGRLWGLVRRTPPAGIANAILDIRAKAGDSLSRHGALGYSAAVGAKLAWFLVLEVSLWSVGIGPAVLPPSVVLTTMAVVGIVALIPITPGAIGVTEVAYVGLLTAVAGDAFAEQITAAIVIYRAAQWLAPIPIGYILLLVMRGSHWRELATDEDGDGGEAAAEAAPGAAT